LLNQLTLSKPNTDYIGEIVDYSLEGQQEGNKNTQNTFFQSKLPGSHNKNDVFVNTLYELLVYVQTQSDSTTGETHKFNDNKLIDLHKKNSVLYIDKYLECAIPEYQTDVLLASSGIPQQKYEAYLNSQGRFWVNYCSNENNDLAEYIIPNVRGGTFNPYMRFLSSKHSGGEQTNKIIDLAGFVYKKLDDIDYKPVVNLLTLTFPYELSFRLLDPEIRDQTISKMWNCYKKFFKDLRFIFGLDPDKILGTTASLHLWSSEFPIMPHPHFHAVIPHFCYSKITKKDRENIEFTQDYLYDELYSYVESSRNQHGKKINFLPLQSLDEINRIRKQISDNLESMLGLEFLPWDGSYKKPGKETLVELPLDVGLLKSVWTDIVNNEFDLQDVYEDLEPGTGKQYDVYTEYCYIDQKAKLQHYLQYKVRPPVLDLDLFFRKYDIIPYPGAIELDNLEQILTDNFITYSLKEVVSKSKKYESQLKKLQDLRKQYSDEEILEWLRYLAVDCNTKTRVFGFWRNIRRYQVSSFLRDPLPLPPICPICGNPTTKVCTVNFFHVSYLIKHSRSKFFVFKIKPPPDEFKADRWNL